VPKPGYPRNVVQFTCEFATEEQCLEYLVRCRWPDGFRCRRCGGERSWPRRDRKAMQCAACGLITSVTAGTAMHRSRLPLKSWLWAAYMVATDKRGVSALALQRQLGLTRYETAYQMLQKLRSAMVAPERTPLFGVVEVDETLIGAPLRGRKDRKAGDKAVVVGAIEVRPTKKSTQPGRLRLRHVPSSSKPRLMAFVKDSIERGALIVTDGHETYDAVETLGYEHGIESTIVGHKQDDVLKHLHTAFSNLKTWLDGTHHGGVSKKHLQRYLDEFAFRFNRRHSPQAAFQTILGIAAKVPPRTYEQVYAGEPAEPLPF
jgi:transposase-like protein